MNWEKLRVLATGPCGTTVSALCGKRLGRLRMLDSGEITAYTHRGVLHVGAIRTMQIRVQELCASHVVLHARVLHAGAACKCCMQVPFAGVACM